MCWLKYSVRKKRRFFYFGISVHEPGSDVSVTIINGYFSPMFLPSCCALSLCMFALCYAVCVCEWMCNFSVCIITFFGRKQLPFILTVETSAHTHTGRQTDKTNNVIHSLTKPSLPFPLPLRHSSFRLIFGFLFVQCTRQPARPTRLIPFALARNSFND